MKAKFSTLLIILLLAVGGKAQYHCIPSIQTHGNPGCGEVLYHGTNWHSGLLPGPVTWQGVHNIGFPFYFNGQLVTQFKVNNNGLLTFDTATTLSGQISDSNVVLPNAQIPDKSICFLGGTPIGSYTNVQFSQQINYSLPVPTLQCWITFFAVGNSTASMFTCWSIVLEEGTNNIYVVDMGADAVSTIKFTVGVQVDSLTAYMAPGSPLIQNISHQGSLYAVGNFYYAFLPDSGHVSDGTVLSSSVPSFLSLTNAPYTVKAKFRNLGKDTVTSLRMNYTINGGTTVSQTFTGLSIPTGNTQWFQFTSAFNPSTAGTYQLDTWADNLSSGPDADNTNDHYVQTLYIANNLPTRRVMCEEFKGTWCTNSGYWTAQYDTLLRQNTSKACSMHYEESPGVNWGYDNRQVSNREFSFYRQNDIPVSLIDGWLLDYPANLSATSGWAYAYYQGNPWILTQAMIDSFSQLSGLFYAAPQLSVANGNIVTASGTVTAALTLPATANCRLYVALVEDTIYPNAGNTYFPPTQSRETILYNTNRITLTGDTGLFIGHPVAGQVDSFSYHYVITDTSCHPSRLHVMVFIQDTLTREIYQSAESSGYSANACSPTYATLNDSICSGDTVYVGTHGHYSAGIFVDTLTNSNSCDSIVNLTLTVRPVPVVTLNYDSLATHFAPPFNWLYCLGGEEPPILLNGGAPMGGYYYGQYVSGDTLLPIPFNYTGPRNDTLFYSYTDSITGCTAVAINVFEVNICEGINTINPNNLFTLYPNPANDYVMIDYDAAYTGSTVLVKDITGRELFKTQLSASPQQLATGSLPPGVYTVMLYNNGQVGARLLLKE